MQTLDTIHHLDGVILAVLVLGAALGACVGIVRPVVWLVTYSLSVYLSAYLNAPVSDQLRRHLDRMDPEAVPSAAFVGTFLAVYLALFAAGVLIRRGLRRLRGETEAAVGAVGLRPLDRLVGAGVGFSLAGLLAGSVLVGLAMSPEAEAKLELGGSKLRPHLAAVARTALDAIPEESRLAFEKAVRRWEETGAKTAGKAAGAGLEGVAGRLNETADKVDAANKATAPFRGDKSPATTK